MAHDHHVYMLLADAAAERRDPAALERYLPRLRELAERDGHQLYIGIARRTEAVARRLAGELNEAQALGMQALEIFAHLDTAWQMGRTRLELASVARAQGDTVAAREHLAQALVQFERLGAAPDSDRTRAELAALG